MARQTAETLGDTTLLIVLEVVDSTGFVVVVVDSVELIMVVYETGGDVEYEIDDEVVLYKMGVPESVADDVGDGVGGSEPGVDDLVST